MQTPQAGRLWQESAPARQTAAFWRVLYSRTLFCTKLSSDDLLVSDRTGRFVAVNVETFGNVRMLTVGGLWLDDWLTIPLNIKNVDGKLDQPYNMPIIPTFAAIMPERVGL